MARGRSSEKAAAALSGGQIQGRLFSRTAPPLGLRLLARLAGRVPPILPSPPQWQLRVAHVVEFAIYVFVIAMPVLGWLSVSAEGKTISFFAARQYVETHVNKSTGQMGGASY